MTLTYMNVYPSLDYTGMLPNGDISLLIPSSFPGTGQTLASVGDACIWYMTVEGYPIGDDLLNHITYTGSDIQTVWNYFAVDTFTAYNGSDYIVFGAWTNSLQALSDGTDGILKWHIDWTLANVYQDGGGQTLTTDLAGWSINSVVAGLSFGPETFGRVLVSGSNYKSVYQGEFAVPTWPAYDPDYIYLPVFFQGNQDNYVGHLNVAGNGWQNSDYPYQGFGYGRWNTISGGDAWLADPNGVYKIARESPSVTIEHQGYYAEAGYQAVASWYPIFWEEGLTPGPDTLSTVATIDHDLLIGVEEDQHHVKVHRLPSAEHIGGFKVKSGVHPQIEDSDFTTPPENGTVAMTYDTQTGQKLWWVRAGGTWDPVEVTS
jgi:hypothetical protein